MSNPFPQGFQNSAPPSFFDKIRRTISSGSSAGDHRRAIEMAALQHQMGIETILAQGDTAVAVNKKSEKGRRKTAVKLAQMQQGHEAGMQQAQFGENAAQRGWQSSEASAQRTHDAAQADLGRQHTSAEAALDRQHGIDTIAAQGASNIMQEQERGRQQRLGVSHTSRVFGKQVDKYRKDPAPGERAIGSLNVGGSAVHFVTPPGGNAPPAPVAAAPPAGGGGGKGGGKKPPAPPSTPTVNNGVVTTKTPGKGGIGVTRVTMTPAKKGAMTKKMNAKKASGTP